MSSVKEYTCDLSLSKGGNMYMYIAVIDVSNKDDILYLWLMSKAKVTEYTCDKCAPERLTEYL